ncbi:TetR/AcrR family transcriptional regulator [Nocardioides aquiterrae]|uniref:HTH tetR-type domain-containing protein n=1 Tax=Nocardioides aquiterrae TaxID=203799 RepID=A0ABP4EUR5_9ACTN
MAAIEMIAEVGLERVTHRAIAARAGVPLGTTTYYFPTLHDLLDAALEHAANTSRTQLSNWATALAEDGRVSTVLPDLVQEYLTDRTRALVDYELYLAAARDVRLRPLALAWLEDATAALAPAVGVETARALVTLIDGAMLQTLVTGHALDIDALRRQVALLTES